MARVLALTRDLLFGSRIQAALSAAGHDVRLVGDGAALAAALADPAASSSTFDDDAKAEPTAAIVIDLTDAELDGAEIVSSLRADGVLGATRTLAFYSHVDAVARERGERAGIDLVVARSRMAREGPQLLERLLAG